MGKNELKELRKQAERAMANAEEINSYNKEGKATVALARVNLYVGELLADRLNQGQYDRAESAIPICTDGDCSDTQYHADHSAPAGINAEMLEVLERIAKNEHNPDCDWEGGYIPPTYSDTSACDCFQNFAKTTIIKAIGEANEDS